MVGRTVVTYEAVRRGALDWRVCVDGVDEHVPFANRESCIAAASTRARLRHVDTGCATEVWAPGYGSKPECLIRYMTPPELDDLLIRSVGNVDWIAGCASDGAQPEHSEDEHPG